MTNEERERHLSWLNYWLNCNHQGDTEPVEALTEAISALEREGQTEARLRWIAEFSGIEGFSHVEGDMFDFAIDVQKDNGTYGVDEPTDEEVFAGFCRMVDKAMEAPNGIN